MEFVSAFINGIVTGSIYALIAIGLSLCFGVLGVLNFAHGSLVMLGMYAAYCSVTYLGLNPYVGIIVVAPLFFLFGVLLHIGLFKFTLDVPPDNQFLVTLGLLIFLNNFAQFIFSPNIQTIQTPFLEQTISIQGIILPYSRILALIVAVSCYILIIIFLKKTYLGKAIVATAQNKEGAQIAGINVLWIYFFTLGISTMLAGIAGLIILPFSAVFPEIGDNFVLTAFIITVLGGMGEIRGTFGAAILIGLTETLGATYMSSSMKCLIPFSIFILVILFRPVGLFSKGK